MIRTFNYDTMDKNLLNRRPALEDNPDVEAAVSEILKQVQSRGDDALREYTLKFDGADISEFLVTPHEIMSAYYETAPELIKVMEKAASNIRSYHRHQISRGYTVTDTPGRLLGQRITPIERVGLYVPGGTASYPSTVLMDAIPAKLAGVNTLIMCTPPMADGRIAPAILAAAMIAGVTHVYKAGGAQAVAAMALGTQSIPAVNKIVGPGNIYVAAAKRRVFGLVDIDMIAGPSDILVIGDSTADAGLIASDMLAQAEHDRMSASVLITDCPELSRAVAREIESQLSSLPRRDIAAAAISNNSMIINVGDLNQAAAVSDMIAPEHLEIITADPFALLPLVHNAGSIFLGANAPEALGDYIAGTNHTIPTMGTARFSSPLSVDDFVKKSSFTYYSRDALAPMIPDIALFARSEGLEGHARSAEYRLGDSI